MNAMICPACHVQQSTHGKCQFCNYESVYTEPELVAALGIHWRELTRPPQQYFCARCGTMTDTWSRCPKCKSQTEPERAFGAVITQWLLSGNKSDYWVECLFNAEGFSIDKENKLCFGLGLSDIVHRIGCKSNKVTTEFLPLTPEQKVWLYQWQTEIYIERPREFIIAHKFCMEARIRKTTCVDCHRVTQRPSVLVMFRHLKNTFKSEYWLDVWRKKDGSKIPL